MFRILIFSAATLLHIHVFWRAACTPAIARRLDRRVLAGTGIFCWAGVLLVRLPGRPAGDLAPMLELAGMSWLVVVVSHLHLPAGGGYCHRLRPVFSPPGVLA